MMQSNLPGLFRMQLLQSLRRVHFNIPILLLQQLSWPLIYILSIYFTYSPFWDGSSQVRELTGQLNLWSYLFSGIIVLNIFQEYVGIGMGMAFERDFGMLELAYLSPVPRYLYLLANVASAVFTALFSLLAFTLVSLILFGITFAHPWISIGIVMYVILMSLPWGTFVASIYLIGRNSRFIYAIFASPAEFFSGTRFPIAVLPGVFFGVALIFPISHGIALLRLSLATELDTGALFTEAGVLAGLALLYGGLSAAVMAYAEHRGKVRGDLSFS